MHIHALNKWRAEGNCHGATTRIEQLYDCIDILWANSPWKSQALIIRPAILAILAMAFPLPSHILMAQNRREHVTIDEESRGEKQHEAMDMNTYNTWHIVIKHTSILTYVTIWIPSGYLT